MATGGHPGGHARGHQGGVEGLIGKAIGNPAPAGLADKLHLIETVPGEETFGFGDRQWRAGAERDETQVKIHLL